MWVKNTVIFIIIGISSLNYDFNSGLFIWDRVNAPGKEISYQIYFAESNTTPQIFKTRYVGKVNKYTADSLCCSMKPGVVYDIAVTSMIESEGSESEFSNIVQYTCKDTPDYCFGGLSKPQLPSRVLGPVTNIKVQ